MFGRVTITLGIGPHSGLFCFVIASILKTNLCIMHVQTKPHILSLWIIRRRIIHCHPVVCVWVLH